MVDIGEVEVDIGGLGFDIGGAGDDMGGAGFDIGGVGGGGGARTMKMAVACTPGWPARLTTRCWWPGASP